MASPAPAAFDSGDGYKLENDKCFNYSNGVDGVVYIQVTEVCQKDYRGHNEMTISLEPDGRNIDKTVEGEKERDAVPLVFSERRKIAGHDTALFEEVIKESAHRPDRTIDLYWGVTTMCGANNYTAMYFAKLTAEERALARTAHQPPDLLIRLMNDFKCAKAKRP